MSKRAANSSRDVEKSAKPEASDSTKPTEAWSRHEHVAPSVQNEAQKLLNEAGSPELAKQAVEEAATQQGANPVNPSYADGLAKRWGYASKDQLLAASKRLTSPRGDTWWATPVGNRGWLAWSEGDMRMSDILPSHDAARQFVAAVDPDSTKGG